MRVFELLQQLRRGKGDVVATKRDPYLDVELLFFDSRENVQELLCSE